MKTKFQTSLLLSAAFSLAAGFCSNARCENASEDASPDESHLYWKYLSPGAKFFLVPSLSNAFGSFEINLLAFDSVRVGYASFSLNPELASMQSWSIEALSPRLSLWHSGVDARIVGGYSQAQIKQNLECNPVAPLFGDPFCSEVDKRSDPKSVHVGVEFSGKQLVVGIRFEELLHRIKTSRHPNITYRDGILESNPSPDPYHERTKFGGAIYLGLQF